MVDRSTTEEVVINLFLLKIMHPPLCRPLDTNCRVYWSIVILVFIMGQTCFWSSNSLTLKIEHRKGRQQQHEGGSNFVIFFLWNRRGFQAPTEFCDPLYVEWNWSQNLTITLQNKTYETAMALVLHQFMHTQPWRNKIGVVHYGANRPRKERVGQWFSRLFVLGLSTFLLKTTNQTEPKSQFV